MSGFVFADLIAICLFAAAWVIYHHMLRTHARTALNAQMSYYRLRWMQEMAGRDVRIVDSAIIASLQNGTAFFASTSLLALGGTAALLRSSDDMMRVATDFPFGFVPTRAMFEIKVIGLLILFGYAFFKFAWAYRLFNYCAILIGATPPAKSENDDERRRIATYAGRMNIAAARQFTRGQRAFFFALAYLGWFLGPYVLMVTTGVVLFFMWSRQYRSEAHDAIDPTKHVSDADAS